MHNEELVGMGATALRALLAGGEVSAVEVVEAHAEAIERRNGVVNAVVGADLDAALAAARRADDLPADERGPLHGLPVAIKDTAAARGLPFTEGHLAYRDRVAPHDDTHVARIRAAGAVVLGKTNIPELAAGGHSQNQVYGRTANPWDLSRSAGGSSGGAAAALAAGFVALADGSDMGGSLRIPASLCGVVGIRPTPGLVPYVESPTIFNPLTTVGPMGRSVADAAMLLGVIASPHPHDPRSYAGDPALARLSVEEPAPVPLAGLRVAYTEDLEGRVPVDPEVRATLRRVAALLEEHGARVETACPDVAASRATFLTLRANEFHTAYRDLLAEHPEQFNDFLTRNILDGESITGRAVEQATHELTRLTRSATDFFEDYDIIVAPVTQLPAFDAEQAWPDEVDGHRLQGYLDWCHTAWAFTPLGIPCMSLPAGFTAAGLPVGVQLLAGPRQESRLLGVAASLESLLDIPTLAPVEALRVH